jgi:Zn ribbon nucleic-acid-binding protein
MLESHWCLYAVCPACVGDPNLEKLVKANLTETECNACGLASDAPIACDLDIVTAHVRRLVERDFFIQPDPVVSDGDDEPFYGESFDATSVLDEIPLEGIPNRLRFYLECELGEKHWCRRKFAQRYCLEH